MSECASLAKALSNLFKKRETLLHPQLFLLSIHPLFVCICINSLLVPRLKWGTGAEFYYYYFIHFLFNITLPWTQKRSTKLFPRNADFMANSVSYLSHIVAGGWVSLCRYNDPRGQTQCKGNFKKFPTHPLELNRALRQTNCSNVTKYAEMYRH